MLGFFSAKLKSISVYKTDEKFACAFRSGSYYLLIAHRQKPVHREILIICVFLIYDGYLVRSDLQLKFEAKKATWKTQNIILNMC